MVGGGAGGRAHAVLDLLGAAHDEVVVATKLFFVGVVVVASFNQLVQHGDLAEATLCVPGDEPAVRGGCRTLQLLNACTCAKRERAPAAKRKRGPKDTRRSPLWPRARAEAPHPPPLPPPPPPINHRPAIPPGPPSPHPLEAGGAVQGALAPAHARLVLVLDAFQAPALVGGGASRREGRGARGGERRGACGRRGRRRGARARGRGCGGGGRRRQEALSERACRRRMQAQSKRINHAHCRQHAKSSTQPNNRRRAVATAGMRACVRPGRPQTPHRAGAAARPRHVGSTHGRPGRCHRVGGKPPRAQTHRRGKTRRRCRRWRTGPRRRRRTWRRCARRSGL